MSFLTTVKNLRQLNNSDMHLQMLNLLCGYVHQMQKMSGQCRYVQMSIVCIFISAFIKIISLIILKVLKTGDFSKGVHGKKTVNFWLYFLEMTVN